MRHAANEGFLLSNQEVKRDILIPRYYDPRIEAELETLANEHILTSIAECVNEGHL
jgi:hypothetical protein